MAITTAGSKGGADSDVDRRERLAKLAQCLEQLAVGREGLLDAASEERAFRLLDKLLMVRGTL